MGEPAPKTYSEPPEPDLRRFGRYTLCYRVARGGMASVYLAQLRSETGFSKWVAIKMIHPRMAADERFVSMFMHEAQILSRLDHPNVCTVFDFGQQGDEYYLAMEYLHGESVASLMRRAREQKMPVPYPIAARIISDAARGLHAAHELLMSDGRPAGVVHRDVSPQNIFLLYEGSSKVVDFGIARSEERGEVTRTGELKGKFHYMAPEQLRQEDIDRRADLFALGIVLWELTTGRRLFKRQRDVDTMMAVLSNKYPRPSEKRDDYPEALENIVMRALAPLPADRFQTCDELARALNNFIVKSTQPADHSEVADFLQSLFADRRRARDELLQKAGDLSNIPVIELESSSESLRSDDMTAHDSPSVPSVRGLERRTIPPPPKAASWIPWIVAGVATASLVVLLGMALWPSSAPPAEAPVVRAPDPPPLAPPEPEPEPEPPAVEPAPIAPAAIVPEPPPPEPARAAQPVRPRVSPQPAPPTKREAPAETPRPRTGPRMMTDFEEIE